MTTLLVTGSRTHGTEHTIGLAKKAGLDVTVHTWDGEGWR